MAAYNNLIVEAICPACAKHGEINCQIHTVASFDGDHRGRFAQKQYRLGNKLPWWPIEDPRFGSWTENSDLKNSDGTVDECTYAQCNSCQIELYVGIRFRDLTPIEMLSLNVDRPGWCIH